MILVPSPSSNLSLAAALERVAGDRRVEGILLLGSTATGRMTVASDYDLMVVLRELPDFYVQVTEIDHRLADVLFVSIGQLQAAIGSGREVDARLAAWLATGRAAYDRGALRKLQDVARSSIAPDIDFDVEAERQQVTYDLLVNENYLKASDEDDYGLALDLRSLHAMSRVLLAYFRVRRILWRGEKAAITSLRDHDPAFLDIVKRWLTASRTERVRLHREAASRALEPIGGPWPAGQFPVGRALWSELIER